MKTRIAQSSRKHPKQLRPRRSSPGDGSTVAPEVSATTGSTLFLLAAVLLVTVLVYLPVLRHEFVNWDDPQNVTSNPIVMAPSWYGFAELWIRPINNMYSPLVFVSFIVDGWISRGNAWSFHLTNLLLHLGSIACVFAIVRTLAPRTAWTAAAGALLFAVHPLQAEPVAWVTGRKDALTGFLVLAAILIHLRAFDMVHKAKRFLAFTSAALLYTAALLAKATVIAMPLALLAILVFTRKASWRRSAVSLAPWFIASLTIGAVALNVQPMPEWLRDAVPWTRRPLLAGYALYFYAWKSILPLGLSPVYVVNASDAAANNWNAIWWCVAIAVAAAALRRGGKSATILCIVVAPLLPVLGLTPFLYQQISLTADRYMYVSMFGCALGLTWVLDSPLVISRPRLAGYAIAAWLFALCFLTYRQVQYWRDSETLWRRAVAVSPGVPEAHTNLAYALHHRGDNRAAEQQLELAVKADSTFNEAWNLLGLLRLDRGEVATAIPALKETVRLLETKGYTDKRLSDARHNLELALSMADGKTTGTL